MTGGARRARSRASRLFGAVARRVLPDELSRQYGADLEVTFDDHWAATSAAGVRARVGLIARETGALARTALVERWRSRGRARRTRPGLRLAGSMRDVRHALRTFARTPGWTALVVATLGLGTAAVVAVFAVVYSALVRPLPYPAPDRLALVWEELPTERGGGQMTVSPADYLAMRDGLRSFSVLGAFNRWSATLTGDGEAERVRGALVTPELLRVTGVRPVLGRLFTEADARVSATRVAVLSFGLWQRRYGGDPGVIGRTVRVSGMSFEVVGVLPAGYRHPEPYALQDEVEIVEPFAMDLDGWATSRGRFLRVIGRLAPGATMAQADAEVAALAQRLAERFPDTNRGFGARVVPLREAFYGAARPALLLALAGAVLLFVIVCANIANLVLVRALGRRREFAVRAALGAGRGRLVRQLAVEGVLLAAAGAAVGLASVVVSLDMLRALEPRFLPDLTPLRVDAPVVGIAVGMAMAVALLLTLLPLAEASRTSVRSVLGEETAGAGGSRSVARIRWLLVAGELAVTAALVVGAGLLGRSFARLAAVDPGFDAGPVVTADLYPGRDSYAGDDELRVYYDRVLERVRALPGVRGAGLASDLPLVTHGDRVNAYEPVDRPLPRPDRPVLEFRTVSSGYFAALGVQVTAGRAFTLEDRGGRSVVVVNQAAARRLWPYGSATGRRVRWQEMSGTKEAEVVGVVADVLDDGLAGNAEPLVYHDLEQTPERDVTIVARTTGDPAAFMPVLRRALRAVDVDVPIDDAGPLAHRVRETLSAPRTAARLATAFSILGLLLSGLGIYGVVAYDVRARTREIGIRTVLGAAAGDVFRLILLRTLALTAAGAVAGTVLGLGIARLLRGFLFGIGAADPAAYLVAPVTLALVAIAAALLPARRALAVAPAEALRVERG